MNELDSHLEKTFEIFKIGSVEKKLQLLKVDTIFEKSEIFLGSDRVRYLIIGSLPKCVQYCSPQNSHDNQNFPTLCIFFRTVVLFLDTLYLIHIYFMVFPVPLNQDF